MSLLAKLFFLVALGSLLALIGLRVLDPNIVVGTNVGFGINAVWAFSFPLGLTEWKLPSSVRLGPAASFITSALIYAATDFICGIQFFSGPVNSGDSVTIPILIFGSIITAIIMMLFWWKVFFDKTPLKPTNKYVHTTLVVVFLGAVALLVFMSHQNP